MAGRTDRQPRIQQGGILEIAQPLNISNVMVICPSCSRPTRIHHDARRRWPQRARLRATAASRSTDVEKKRK